MFVKILENEIWKFGRNLPLATFGSERVKDLKPLVSLTNRNTFERAALNEKLRDIQGIGCRTIAAAPACDLVVEFVKLGSRFLLWSFCYLQDVFNNVVLSPKVQVVLYRLCTFKIFVLSCFVILSSTLMTTSTLLVEIRR